MNNSNIIESIPVLGTIFVLCLVFIFKVNSFFSKTLKPKFDEVLEHQQELDRYLASNFSISEIGTFYERYIGYLFEIQGFHVQYHGAVNGFDDLGRDLIINNGNETWIVQTKCWSNRKRIQEKHIHQLYGSLEHYKRQHKKRNVKALFFTTASYSNKAKEAANVLGVELIIEKLDRSYPMIKCNISNTTKNKVYHFPYDDCYDSIVIEPHKGEFFAKTVKEAVDKGFRRARKYKKAS